MRHLVSFLVLFFVNAAFAQSEYPNYTEPNLTVEEIKKTTRVRAQLIDSHVSSVLGKTRIALMGLSELIGRNNLPDKELHLLLKRTTAEIGNIRAIILLDQNGFIVSDSTKLPAQRADLSKREYFKSSMIAKRGKMYIGSVVKGSQSGFNFIPLSLPIYFDGKVTGVLAAVLTPEELLPRDADSKCLLCMSIVTDTEGGPLIQFPSGGDIEYFTRSLPDAKRPESGSAAINVGQNPAIATWISNSDFDIISIYLQYVR